MPGAVTVGAAGCGFAAGGAKLAAGAGVTVALPAWPCGTEFNGAPTGISHLWPGCPCGGFMPGAVAVAAAGLATGVIFAAGAGAVVAAGLLSRFINAGLFVGGSSPTLLSGALFSLSLLQDTNATVITAMQNRLEIFIKIVL